MKERQPSILSLLAFALIAAAAVAYAAKGGNGGGGGGSGPPACDPEPDATFPAILYPTDGSDLVVASSDGCRQQAVVIGLNYPSGYRLTYDDTGQTGKRETRAIRGR